jgi:alpha-glucosidase (family GH31 glycosyl hydrolase)
MLAPKGVNFWWTDYGGCAPPSPNLLPLVWSARCPTAHQFAFDTQQLLWSNYVYDSALQATGVRPLVLSRYGGIGNQRHGIGFKGDTQATWSTLKLQVAMTSTAANVLFGCWSLDLGGYNIYCPSNL